MGRGGGGGSRGGSHHSSGSRGGSFRSSSSGRSHSSSSGRGRSSSSFHSSGSHYRSTHVHYHGGGTYYRGPYSEPVDISGRAVGIVVTIILIVILLFAFIGVVGFIMGTSGSITASTIDRTPLDKQYTTISSDWFDDSAMNWISSKSKLDKGLRYFYDKTGVAPYLIITDQVNGNYSPSGQEVYSYALDVYDLYCYDEGHMLFAFQCPDGGTDYNMAAVTGQQAKTVVDDEALEILYDYLDSYFYSSRSEDDMFADAFHDAADRMMVKSPNPVAQIARAMFGIVFVIGAILIVIMVLKHRKAESERTQQILSTPIEKIGDKYDEADDLAAKYEDKEKESLE